MSGAEFVEQALKMSKVDDLIAIGFDRSTANIRWANNTVTTNGVTTNREIFLISVRDKRTGSAGTNYFPPDRLEAVVRASEERCDGRPVAEDYQPLASGGAPDQDWGADPETTDIGVFDRLAADLGGLFKQAAGAGVKLFGFAEHTASTVHLATSTGIRRRHSQASGQVEVNAKSDDFGRSVWAGNMTKDFADIDMPSIFEHLRTRLDWSENQISLEPGRYETILEPSALADLLVDLYWHSNARDADEGRTVFSKAGGGNRAGEKLFPDAVTIHSDPFELGFEVAPFVVSSGSYLWDPNRPSFDQTPSPASASMFDNGLDIPKTEWVSGGKLNKLITPRYWATRSKVDPAFYTPNLFFDSDGPMLDEMISASERALLVTCVWYVRVVDPQTLLLTGLTRDGVFLVEDGRVKGAVNNFRFNMSPVDLLAQSSEIGRSEKTLPREFGDYFTFCRMPPLRVPDFNMSSVSQAT